MQFRQTLSPDRQNMRLEGFDGGKMIFWANLNAVNVENLISQLGRMRAEMQPENPKVFAPPITEVAYTTDPVWRVPRADTPERTLILRHNWFGWLGFVFPSQEATNVAFWLGKKSA